MLAEDTLCLTKEGYWKRWNQLSLGELVYAFDWDFQAGTR